MGIRRHQQQHQQEPEQCAYPGCTFFAIPDERVGHGCCFVHLHLGKARADVQSANRSDWNTKAHKASNEEPGNLPQQVRRIVGEHWYEPNTEPYE